MLSAASTAAARPRSLPTRASVTAAATAAAGRVRAISRVQAGPLAQWRRRRSSSSSSGSSNSSSSQLRLRCPCRRHVAVGAAAAEAEVPTGEARPNLIVRVLSVLPYVLPVIESLGFGRELWESYAVVSKFVIFFNPILMLYHSNNVIPFMVFFMLFLLVVRNTKLPHFVRFNAMQSMLLDISLMLAALIITYMPIDLIRTAFGRFCCTFTFLTSISAVLYSVVYSLQGKYADIPVLSEACYIQVRPE